MKAVQTEQSAKFPAEGRVKLLSLRMEDIQKISNSDVIISN